MDHHCPWVNNCVGIGNHKFFIQFISYVFVISVYALLLAVCRFCACLRNIGSCQYSPSKDLGVVFLVVEVGLRERRGRSVGYRARAGVFFSRMYVAQFFFFFRLSFAPPPALPVPADCTCWPSCPCCFFLFSLLFVLSALALFSGLDE